MKRVLKIEWQICNAYWWCIGWLFKRQRSDNDQFCGMPRNHAPPVEDKNRNQIKKLNASNPSSLIILFAQRFRGSSATK